jgi:hypothetical protein
MITIFAMPKAFRGHIAVIQGNAIGSWTLLAPDVEVILFGDEEGTADFSREARVHHEPQIARNEFGAPLLNDLFERAQRLAGHEIVSYCNADIILTADFVGAAKQVAAWRKEFLMVGRRWDLSITEPVDFKLPEWQPQLKSLATETGMPRTSEWIDYFVFPRGLYQNLPPLAIGRRWWDNWLIWKLHAEGIPVVDASQAVIAIHQNHGYAHHPLGKEGVLFAEEPRRNFELCGGWNHLYTMDDATHALGPHGIRPRRYYQLAPARRKLSRRWESLKALGRVYVKHPVLDFTRPWRQRLGLRKVSLSNTGDPRAAISPRSRDGK